MVMAREEGTYVGGQGCDLEMRSAWKSGHLGGPRLTYVAVVLAKVTLGDAAVVAALQAENVLVEVEDLVAAGDREVGGPRIVKEAGGLVSSASCYGCLVDAPCESCRSSPCDMIVDHGMLLGAIDLLITAGKLRIRRLLTTAGKLTVEK